MCVSLAAQVQSSLSYRAKQRGFLELDLLVARALPQPRAQRACHAPPSHRISHRPSSPAQGGWAEAHLPTLSDEELAAFAVVLDAENPDLFKWLTGQAAPPAAMAANPAYVKLAAHVAAHLAAHARAATRSAAGKDWVRGWTDTGFPTPGGASAVPSSGNQQ